MMNIGVSFLGGISGSLQLLVEIKAAKSKRWPKLMFTAFVDRLHDKSLGQQELRTYLREIQA